jgi:hypothetical protein
METKTIPLVKSSVLYKNKPKKSKRNLLVAFALQSVWQELQSNWKILSKNVRTTFTFCTPHPSTKQYMRQQNLPLYAFWSTTHKDYSHVDLFTCGYKSFIPVHDNLNNPSTKLSTALLCNKNSHSFASMAAMCIKLTFQTLQIFTDNTNEHRTAMCL